MNQKGFTLIELVIVMGIMAVMFLIVAVSGSSFNDRLLLKKATDEISFLFRQAQVEGLAVLEDPENPDEFKIGYGVYMRIPSGNAGNNNNVSNNSLIYFVDRNDDGRYGGNFTCNDECESEVELDRVIITELNSDCNSGQGLSSVFRRPRPEITIKAHSGNQNQVCTEIILTLKTLSPEASTATVTIRSAAEINVVYN